MRSLLKEISRLITVERNWGRGHRRRAPYRWTNLDWDSAQRQWHEQAHLWEQEPSPTASLSLQQYSPKSEWRLPQEAESTGREELLPACLYSVCMPLVKKPSEIFKPPSSAFQRRIPGTQTSREITGSEWDGWHTPRG